MTNSIPEIINWLTKLREGAADIASAGANGGAQAAVRDGFRARTNGNVVRVDFRGKRRMDSVEPAMRSAMVLQFDRGAR